MKPKIDIYETVTNKIVAAIEAGAGKFQMPWHTMGMAGVPSNVATKKAYRGMNTVLLAMSDPTTMTWGTYKQWTALGAQVRKGEKATHCVKWNVVDVVDKNDPTAPPRRRMFPYGFAVFSQSQVDGYVPPEPEEIVDQTKVLKKVDKVVAALGADIRHGGSKAFYSPGGHFVQVPDRRQFQCSKGRTATEAYYGTLLHELTHWTGHSSMLDRHRPTDRFGDEAYAFEELIAELGAAFTCATLKISNEPRQDHAQYIASWLRVLRNDKRAIFSAASQAQKACDIIVPPPKKEE